MVVVGDGVVVAVVSVVGVSKSGGQKQSYGSVVGVVSVVGDGVVVVVLVLLMFRGPGGPKNKFR